MSGVVCIVGLALHGIGSAAYALVRNRFVRKGEIYSAPSRKICGECLGQALCEVCRVKSATPE